MGIELVENLLTTVKAVASIVVILCTGVGLVKTNVLNQEGITALSKLVNYLFLPIALFSRLGSTLTAEVLAKTWMLPLIGLVPVALSFLVGWAILPLTGAPRWFRPWIVLGVAFPNNLALPLVFLTSICSQVEFEPATELGLEFANATEFSASGALTPTQCREYGELYLFLGNLFSTFVFWLFAYDLAAWATGVRGPMGGEAEAKTGNGAALVVGDEASEGQDTDAESLASAEAGTVVAAPPGPLGMGQEQVPTSASAREQSAATAKCYKVLWMLLQPPTFAQLLAILVGLVPPVQAFVFEESSAFSPVIKALGVFSLALVPALNLVLSGSLGLKLCSIKSIWEPDLASVGLSARTVIVLVVTRMMLLPVLSFGALYGLQVAGAMPSNRLVSLVFYFTVLTPISNGPVVLAQTSGNAKAGQALAMVIMFQYLAGVVTMSVSVFFALAMFSTS